MEQGWQTRVLLEPAYPTEGSHSLSRAPQGLPSKKQWNSLPTVPSSLQHTEDEDGAGCPYCKARQAGNLTLD